VPSAAFYDRSLDDALTAMSALADLGEVFSEGHHSLLDQTNLAAAQAAVATGLQLTVHGPFNASSPACLDESRRRAAVDEHRRHLEAAAACGAVCYVVHPDYSVEPRSRDPGRVAAMQLSITELTELQSELGVPIAVENMPGPRHSIFAAPGELDLGELGLVLDTGHAAISGTLQAFLAEPRARLAHMHLQDNRGPVDDDDPHRPLGAGVVDAATALSTAHAAGATVILELLNEADLLASIDWLGRQGLVGQG
jgi:sugar phosphate isomerase/epimerase